MLNFTPTTRGFLVAIFVDRYQNLCSIQESSLATENCIWLGLDAPDAGARMHLTQDMARELAEALVRFADTGNLNPDQRKV